jgi:hypothetical protein
MVAEVRPGDSESTNHHGNNFSNQTLGRQETHSTGDGGAAAAFGPVRYCLRGVYAVSRAAIGRLVGTVYGGSSTTTRQQETSRVVVSAATPLERRSSGAVVVGPSFVLPVVKFSTMQVSLVA